MAETVVLPYPLGVAVATGQPVTASSYALPEGMGLEGVNHTATEDLAAGDKVVLVGEAPGTAHRFAF